MRTDGRTGPDRRELTVVGAGVVLWLLFMGSRVLAASTDTPADGVVALVLFGIPGIVVGIWGLTLIVRRVRSDSRDGVGPRP